MRVLVTGGAGYIGSVAVEQALSAGHEVAVLDNLWRGHRAAVSPDTQLFMCDLRDAVAIKNAVGEFRPDTIMHFAAATIVPESMDDPLGYFEINTVGSHNLISAAIANNVEQFIFSSTAAVYGNATGDVITEELSPSPINPYGRSKLMVEQMLEWHARRYGLHVAVFRYFNVAGSSALRGEDHTPETHLIPVALQFADGKRDAFTVFGTDYDTPDGTCIRDYVHVMDLADAHVLAARWLENNDWGVFNLGTTTGTSVQEIVRAVEGIVDRTLPVTYGERRPGDPARLVASADKARTELGWDPTRSNVETMVGSAWEWMQRNPNGYAE